MEIKSNYLFEFPITNKQRLAYKQNEIFAWALIISSIVCSTAIYI